MKVAKLVTIELITRVIVDENATDEEIVEAAKAGFQEKLDNNELLENLESIKDDTEMLAEGRWVCTDPDNDQYRLDKGEDKYKDTVFTFKQGDEQMTIDITEYPKDEVKSILASFGYTEQMDDFYTDATGAKVSNDIIAECIFETEIGAA